MNSLMPLRDAAREFGVDRTTLHRHIRAGRLRAFRRPMDRRTYVDRNELDELLTFRPRQTDADPPRELERRTAMVDALARLAEFRERLRRAGRPPVDAVQLVREGREDLDRRH